SEADRDGVRKWARRAGLSLTSDEGGVLGFELSGTARAAVRKRGMAQVLEVLRRRITDPVQGIQDSVVTGQGEGRVLVQIPGGQIDRTRAQPARGDRPPRVQDREGPCAERGAARREVQGR